MSSAEEQADALKVIPTRRRKLALSLVGAALVSAILLGYLLLRTDGLARAVALARSASGWWLAFSVSMYLVSNTIRTWRWSVLLPSGPDAFRRLYSISSIHTMVNMLLPARLGELAFPILMRTHAATSAPRSVTMVFLARALDAALLGLMFVGGTLVHFRADLPVVAITASLMALTFAVVLILGSARLLSWVLRQWEERFPHRSGLSTIGRAAEAELVDMTASKKLLAAAALTALLVLTRHVFFWATLQAIGVRLGLAAVVCGATFGEATYLLPVHGLAGLGTVEAGWALGMSIVGLPMADAVASGLFVHAWSIILATGVGILCLPVLRRVGRHSSPS